MDRLVSPFYDRIKKYQESISSKAKTSQLLGNARLLLAVVIIYAGYQGIRYGKESMYLLMIAGLVGFIVFAVYHKRVKDEIAHLKGLVEINNKYLKRISGEWSNFYDKGEELASKDHLYAYDLDIVGEKSLFQLINTTKTWYGRAALADKLLGAPPTIEEIEQRQKAILELGSKLDFAQEMEYLGTKQKKLGQFPAKLFRYTQKSNNMLAGTAAELLIKSAPLIFIVLVGVGYFADSRITLLLGIGGMIFQYLISMLFYPKTAESLGVAREIGYELGN